LAALAVLDNSREHQDCVDENPQTDNREAYYAKPYAKQFEAQLQAASSKGRLVRQWFTRLVIAPVVRGAVKAVGRRHRIGLSGIDGMVGRIVG
jgi:hypothetical protein